MGEGGGGGGGGAGGAAHIWGLGACKQQFTVFISLQYLYINRVLI